MLTDYNSDELKKIIREGVREGIADVFLFAIIGGFIGFLIIKLFG